MYKILAFILLFLVSASVSDPLKQAQPDWINNPGQGAVGTSTTHVAGCLYLEELAILRAREKLAAQYGVKISSVYTYRGTCD